jgi:hypothetical protein
LPMHPYMSDADVETVTSALLTAVARLEDESLLAEHRPQ